jgi:hypothetical protein
MNFENFAAARAEVQRREISTVNCLKLGNNCQQISSGLILYRRKTNGANGRWFPMGNLESSVSQTETLGIATGIFPG